MSALKRNKKLFTILLDGALSLNPRLLQHIAGSRCIAADGGMRHAAALGLQPELWLGDFDSTSPDLLHHCQTVPRQRFPRAKDKTDGALAAEAALAKGAEQLILCGAFGGSRLDHSLQHITFAIDLAQKRIPCLLTDGITEGYPLIAGTYDFDFPQGTVFSIIPFSDMADLTILGAKWNLDKYHLKFGSSHTISNESRDILHISLQSGYGILLAQPNLQEKQIGIEKHS